MLLWAHSVGAKGSAQVHVLAVLGSGDTHGNAAKMGKGHQRARSP